MDIIKCSEFITEAKASSKKDCIEDLLKMFDSKPLVKMDTTPDEKGMYSLAGMKKHLLDKYKSSEVDNAWHDIQNNKEHKSSIGNVYVNISIWKEKLPYWYMNLTKVEADKLVTKYEKDEKEKNSEKIKKTSAKLASVKASSKDKGVERKEVGSKGVERKEGAPEKKKRTSKAVAPRKTATKKASPKKK